MRVPSVSQGLLSLRESLTCVSGLCHRGSCYPLRIPENSEEAVIHYVVASDADTGINGEITYSITGQHRCTPEIQLMAAPKIQPIGLQQQLQGRSHIHRHVEYKRKICSRLQTETANDVTLFYISMQRYASSMIPMRYSEGRTSHVVSAISQLSATVDTSRVCTSRHNSPRP